MPAHRRAPILKNCPTPPPPSLPPQGDRRAALNPQLSQLHERSDQHQREKLHNVGVAELLKEAVSLVSAADNKQVLEDAIQSLCNITYHDRVCAAILKADDEAELLWDEKYGSHDSEAEAAAAMATAVAGAAAPPPPAAPHPLPPPRPTSTMAALISRMEDDGEACSEVALKVSRCLCTIMYQSPPALRKGAAMQVPALAVRLLEAHCGKTFVSCKLITLITILLQAPGAITQLRNPELETLRVLQLVKDQVWFADEAAKVHFRNNCGRDVATIEAMVRSTASLDSPKHAAAGGFLSLLQRQQRGALSPLRGASRPMVAGSGGAAQL